MPVRQSPPPPLPKLDLCPPEFESLVVAVQEGRLHIIPQGQGFHVHFGDLADMPRSDIRLSPSTVSFSNAACYAANDGYIEAHGIKVPTSTQKLQEARGYMLRKGIL